MDTSSLCRLGRVVLFLQGLPEKYLALYSRTIFEKAMQPYLSRIEVSTRIIYGSCIATPANKAMNAEQALEKLEAIQRAFPEAQIKEIALLIMRQELAIDSALGYMKAGKWITAQNVLEHRTHEGSFNCEPPKKKTT